MKGIVYAALAALLVISPALAQNSIFEINFFRELCMGPCRATCSFFSLGCSQANCQPCMRSCDGVCDTRSQASFPDVFGVRGLLPSFLIDANPFAALFGGNPSQQNDFRQQQQWSTQTGSGGGLWSLFTGGNSQNIAPPPPTQPSSGGGLWSLFTGGGNGFGSSSTGQTGPSSQDNSGGGGLWSLFNGEGFNANSGLPEADAVELPDFRPALLNILTAFANVTEGFTELVNEGSQALNQAVLDSVIGDTSTETSNSTSNADVEGTFDMLNTNDTEVATSNINDTIAL